MQSITQLQWRYVSADWVMCSERCDDVQKHVFVRVGDILSICPSQALNLVGTRRDGDTKQLTKHKQLTTELNDKMTVQSSEDRYVLCSRNLEMGTNSEKSVLEFFLFQIES